MLRELGYKIADAADWLRHTGAGHLVLGLVAVVAAFGIALAIGGSDSSPDGTDTGTGISPTATGDPPTPGTVEATEAYPTVATRNTTRVDTTDSIQTAAAVARLAWPGSQAGTSPTAVSMVDSNDWMSAVAATSLTAAPVSAPVLYSLMGDLPEATMSALELLNPTGAGGSDNAQAFVLGGSPMPPETLGLTTREVVGDDPPATAAMIADLRVELTGEEPENLIVVSGDLPGYALPAASWAARSGDAILFVLNGEVPESTIETIEKYPDANVWVLGPEEAISEDNLTVIADSAEDGATRIGAQGISENSVAFARFHDRDTGFGWNITDPGHGIIVANAARIADAAAVAPLSAGGTWGPLLLVEQAADQLPEVIAEHLLDTKPGYDFEENDPTRAVYTHIWVIGDIATMPLPLQAQLDELAEAAPVSFEE